MLTPWLPPRVCSRQGAAHRRRGQPCQDFSLACRIAVAGAEPLTLLAVADGHGAAAYRHSAVGSALACRVAAAVVEEALGGGPGAGSEAWPGDGAGLRSWLAAELPALLQRRWRAAVAEHWRAGPGAGGEPFSPVPYGTTLGLVLLGASWWAHAGLGDWDLVRIDAAGNAELLSQEEALLGAPEATASLCQAGEPLRGWRSGLWPLEADVASFALVLSSDGLRKSCASDGDFLALARWLADLTWEGPEVAAGGAAPWATGVVIGAGEAATGTSVAGAASGAAPSATGVVIGAGEVEQELAAALDRISAEGCGDDGSVAIAHWSGGPGRCTAAAGSADPGSGLMVLLVTAGLALVGLGLGALVGRPPAPEPGAAWRREVERLCRAPELVGPSLRSRRSQVLALGRGQIRPEALLADRARDPLGALIAAGFPATAAEPLRQSGFHQLPLCPALRQALASLWITPPPAAISPSPPPPMR